jgi:hypothetical protein
MDCTNDFLLSLSVIKRFRMMEWPNSSSISLVSAASSSEKPKKMSDSPWRLPFKLIETNGGGQRYLKNKNN